MNRAVTRLQFQAAIGGGAGRRRAGTLTSRWTTATRSGCLEGELHWACDVSDFDRVKREALRATRASPTPGQMLAMPEQMFAAGFGVEHFIEPGGPEGMVGMVPRVAAVPIGLLIGVLSPTWPSGYSE